MKKFISAFLCAVLLICAFSVTSFAASDIEFSVVGANATPGDTVEVKVYLDKNPGTWAAKFLTHFNDKYFTLLSVKNGSVFTDGEFSKGLLTNKGFYVYYAEGYDPTVNNENTGLILTLTFEVASTCPNGNHEIYLSFPDDGKGWFFDATEFPDFDTVFSISCTQTGFIKVTGSDYETDPSETTAPVVDDPDDTTGSGEPADSDGGNSDSNDTDSNDTGSNDTGSKDTDSKDTDSKDTDSKDTGSGNSGGKDTDSNASGGNDDTTAPVPGIPVTEVVTDEAGDAVKDEEGEVVTTEVVDSDGNQLFYETDEVGSIVTDADGGEVTFAETTASPDEEGDETTGKGDSETTGIDDSENKDPDDSDKADDGKNNKNKGLSVQQIILIVAVIAVVVGAVIIVIVVTKSKKDEDGEENTPNE